jgi:hypothetical protein
MRISTSTRTRSGTAPATGRTSASPCTRSSTRYEPSPTRTASTRARAPAGSPARALRGRRRSAP